MTSREGHGIVLKTVSL